METIDVGESVNFVVRCLSTIQSFGDMFYRKDKFSAFVVKLFYGLL